MEIGLLNRADFINMSRGIFAHSPGVIFAPTFCYQTFRRKPNLDKILDNELEPELTETIKKMPLSGMQNLIFQQGIKRI